MSQIEAPKVVSYVLTGSDANEISVSKVVMYLLLEPGDIEAGDTATRQSHVHAQRIRRR